MFEIDKGSVHDGKIIEEIIANKFKNNNRQIKIIAYKGYTKNAEYLNMIKTNIKLN